MQEEDKRFRTLGEEMLKDGYGPLLRKSRTLT